MSSVLKANPGLHGILFDFEGVVTPEPSTFSTRQGSPTAAISLPEICLPRSRPTATSI